MAAYMIFTRLKTTDQSEMDTYAGLAGGTLAGRPVTPHVRYGEQETLEGPSTEGTVIVSFPTKADALDWYNSPEYTAARAHHMAGSEYMVTVIEGV